jgi:hypothetical protein
MRTVEHIIYDIHRQFPLWPSTYSTCQDNGCEKRARGGERCLDCLQDELTELTSKSDAKALVDAVFELHKIKYRLIHA